MIPSSGSTTASRMALAQLQRRRKFVIASFALVLLFALPLTHSLVGGTLVLHEWVEVIGLGMIAVAILGRGWCTLYIGGRKAQALTDVGPYSISRNPLYVFSFIGAAGIGAQTGSIVIALFFVAGAAAIFLPVILREERALEDLFGASFTRYKDRVPRFGPAFARWKDADTIEVRPKLVWRTLRDGLVFLMFMPLFEAIEWLQMEGYIRPLLHLP